MHDEAVDRRALKSVGVQFFANGATYATIIPRLPEIRDQVGISIGTLGLVLTVASIASLIGSAFAGRVTARIGSRRVMIYGATMSIGFLPIIGFATSAVVLAAALFGLLFFDIFIDVAMNVQGSALSARRHTPVMNRLHGLWSLGTVAGGVLTVVLLRAGVSTEVQLTFVALVLIGSLLFVAPGLLHRDEAPELDDEVAAIEGRTHLGRVDIAAMLLAVGGASAMAVEITNGDWSSFRLGDDLGAAPGVAGLAFLAFTGGMTIGRLSGDWVQVRVGPVRLIRISTGVMAVGAVLAMLVPSVPVAIVGFLIGGLGTSVLFPQLYDRAARAPGPPGSGFAFMLVGQRGAGVVTPLIVGALANSSTFGVGQAMAIVVLPSILAMFLTTLARR
ncbi:MAG: MFS transporter [Acidimicrobiales bacterium]|nr:MAG: MFS transporter [Acidimicrobiales bacterium]